MRPVRRTLPSTSPRTKWASLSIPISLLLMGLAFRLAGVLHGWGTLLIVGGIIGGAMTAYTVAYGSHERTLDLQALRASNDAKW